MVVSSILLLKIGQWTLILSGFLVTMISVYLLWGGFVQSAELDGRLAERAPAVEVDWEILDKIPQKIMIPTRKIDLEVVPGQVLDGEWEVSEVAANYLIGSGVTGDVGNMVIYAHKRPHLFGKLADVTVGERVQVVAGDVVTVYEVIKKSVVAPDDVSILQPSPLAELTLYTCEGWKDEQRLVVRGRLIKRFRSGFGGLLAGEEL